MPLLPHSRLGPYEVIGLLGAGGMGEVYRARDTRLGRDVAIKVLPERAAADTARRRRFEQEARAASALNHPNICTIHDIDEQDGAPYIIMELLEGLPLREALSQGPLPPSRLLQAATQVADALEAAHAAGIIHRDLTPANIFLTTRGDAKVLDFGLAKLHAGEEPACDREATTATADPPLTAAGRMLGTPGYASPEQTLGLPLDCRSDLFSFGAVLYEMATGRRAFSGENPALAGDAVVHASPPPVPSVNPAAPRGLAAIIDKAIEKDPALRYQSAAELKADLRRLMRDAGYPTPGVEGHPRSAGAALPVSAPTRRRPRLVAFLLALVLVAVVSVAYIVYDPWHAGREPLPDALSIPFTSGPFVAIEPALSPDGHTMAYVVDDGSHQSIWMTETRGNPGTQWTTTPGRHRHPAWAPDGRIFFESGTGEAQGIYWAPSFDSKQAALVVKGGREPAVSADGKRLAFVAAGKDGFTRISVVGVDHWSAITPLTHDGHGRWDHTAPTWSPDGRWICYAAADGLWRVPTAGGSPTQLSKGVDAHPAWSNAGFIYFSSLREGVWQLWRMAPDGKRAQRVTQGVGTEQMSAVSRDGRVLVFSTATDESEIVVRDLLTRTEVSVGGGGNKLFPSFGPGARSVVFLLDAWNRRCLWEQPLAAGRPDGPMRPVAAGDRDAGSTVTASQPAISPDGRWVAFLEIDGDAREICVMPAGGGTRVDVTNHPAADYLPAWAPDSRRLAFVSERDGHQHVWIQQVSEGRAVGPPARVSTGAPSEQAPAWSPDGARVAFVIASGSTPEVAIADIARPAAPVVVTSGARAQRVRWSSRTGRLWVVGLSSTGRYTLRAYDPGRRDHVAAFAEIDLGRDPREMVFDISADERYLAYVRVNRSGHIGMLQARAGRY